jgi:hypothetical protein
MRETRTEIYEYALRKAGVVSDEARLLMTYGKLTGAELCGIRPSFFRM